MWKGFRAMWSFVAWFMLGRVRSQSAQNSPDTSCMLQFSAARHIEAAEPDCLSSNDWTEQLRVTALNFSGGISGAGVFTGAEDDVSLMAWSPSAGPAPGDVLVFNSSMCSDSPGWQLQANLTEIASQNVALPFDWARNTALSSEKIVVALSLVNDTSTTHTFKYDGASWAFLGRQSFPGIRSTTMALGGDLLVLLSFGTFQTFQLQGSMWSLVPTAELQLDALRFATDGRTLTLEERNPVVQLSVYQWTGNSWSSVANISPPASPPVGGLGLDVDGDYIIAGWTFLAGTAVDYVTVIYEEQGGQWSEVFRISNDLVQPPTTFGISSSGKAVVNCAGAVGCAGVTVFEVTSNGTWAEGQSFNESSEGPNAVSLASAAILGFSWGPPSPRRFRVWGLGFRAHII
ncbi:Ttc26 [Symbiodinium necroappetens]|uniref:Ttc26 protein n=1 Tax=Symbiodinium necroappetens TaxID=1628268 RepID=A0A812YN72_9DINO|nr:Ttc26 [Symbiodinium necroappetens]